MTSRRLSAALALLVLALGAGCNKKDTPPGGAPPSAPGAGPKLGAAGPNDPPGLAQFRTRGCANCHSTPQTGPARGKRGGPDLATVAADPAHTREWLLNYIRDPHGQNPQSKMPKFAGKLSEEEMGQVADFLLTLK